MRKTSNMILSLSVTVILSCIVVIMVLHLLLDHCSCKERDRQSDLYDLIMHTYTLTSNDRGVKMYSMTSSFINSFTRDQKQRFLSYTDEGIKIRDWDVYEIDCPMEEYLGQVEIEVEDGQELTCQFIYER